MPGSQRVNYVFAARVPSVIDDVPVATIIDVIACACIGQKDRDVPVSLELSQSQGCITVVVLEMIEFSSAVNEESSQIQVSVERCVHQRRPIPRVNIGSAGEIPSRRLQVASRGGMPQPNIQRRTQIVLGRYNCQSSDEDGNKKRT